jgi:UDP-N-acetylmuramate--alanine ligase
METGKRVFRKTRRIHFVGIGGVGMGGIAEVCLNLGYVVTGSDARGSAVVERLRRIGCTVHTGHKADQVEGADVVVVSSAVPAENVEVRKAHELSIPVIPRAEMLAELMRMKVGIAVGGTHGKTTTTSMIAQVLDSAGLDPTIVLGGRLDILGSGAKLGQGTFMVAEADESDRSFLKLLPTFVVVTNIEREHMENYRDFRDLKGAFLHFINSVPFYGVAVLCVDDPNIGNILSAVKRRILTYGNNPVADFSVEDISLRKFGSAATVLHHGKPVGRMGLRVPGRHNILNALAAFALCRELEIAPAVIFEALGKFGGTDRRLQLKGRKGDLMVFDDYGHHPTEIEVTLTALKEAWGKPIVAVFQPHRFSRVATMKERFIASLDLADSVVVTEIYPAGEEPIPGVSGEGIFREMERAGRKNAYYAPTLEEIPPLLRQITSGNEIVVTFGAGDIWKAAEGFVRLLEEP